MPGPRGNVDQAIWHCLFLLDVSKLVIALLMCPPSVVGHEWSQPGKLASFILCSDGLPALPLVSWQSW